MAGQQSGRVELREYLQPRDQCRECGKSGQRGSLLSVSQSVAVLAPARIELLPSGPELQRNRVCSPDAPGRNTPCVYSTGAQRVSQASGRRQQGFARPGRSAPSTYLRDSTWRRDQSDVRKEWQTRRRRILRRLQLT